MTSIRSRLTRLALVAALAVPQAAAGQGAPGTSPTQGPTAGTPAAGQNAGTRRPLGRAVVLAKAIRSLDLSPAQRKSIRAVRARHDTKMREIGRKFLDELEQIDALMFAEPPAVDRAREAARELARLSGQRATTRTIVESEIFEQLTPEQRTALRRERDAMREQGLIPPARPAAAAPATATPPDDDDDALDAGDDDGSDDVISEAGSAPATGLGAKPKGARMPRTRPGDLFARMALTPAQRLRLRQVRRQHGPEMRRVKRAFFDAQAAVDDALLADRVDADLVHKLADALGAAERDRAMARFESEAAIRQLLTPEQAALLRQSRGVQP